MEAPSNRSAGAEPVAAAPAAGRETAGTSADKNLAAGVFAALSQRFPLRMEAAALSAAPES